MDSSGTGDVFAVIDFGEPVGRFEFRDDGDHDSHAGITHIAPDGTSTYFGRSGWDLRRDLGDSAIGGELKTAFDPDPTPDLPSTRYNAGPFVCDDCHRTWPGNDNQTPDAPGDTCPDCAEE